MLALYVTTLRPPAHEGGRGGGGGGGGLMLLLFTFMNNYNKLWHVDNTGKL